MKPALKEPKMLPKMKVSKSQQFYVADFETVTINTNHFMNGNDGVILA